MYLVAIAWIYVVLMMAAAEALSPRGSLLGALLTLLLYGVAPLALLLYILGTPHRRRRAAAQAGDATANSGPAPDGGSEAATDPVAAVGKEP